MQLPEGQLHEVLHDEVSSWDCQHPVLLNVPTGQGKTTFVYEELLKRIEENNTNLLIVSNRLALLLQQKLAVMERTNDARQGLFTKEGLRQLEDFGRIRIITYHRLSSLLSDPSATSWLANLSYVVFDEAHFFVADACFNEWCDYLLKLATSRFCRAVRIYMSATMWDVMDPIAEAELKNYHNLTYPHPPKPIQYAYHYYRQANYEGYKLRFFDDLKDLLPEINKDPKIRWLVFVDSKEKGKAFTSELGGRAAYLDSENKSGPVWEKLLDDGCFDKQVLISTAVLDCGCNINDASLRNIVVMTDDRTSFIQMIGRKRRRDAKSVTVWVHDLGIQSISARERQCQTWLRWYERFDHCVTQSQRMKVAQEIWKSDAPALRKLFHLGEHDLYPNKLARYSIERRLAFYTHLLEGSTTFQEEVMQWLGYPKSTSKNAKDILERFYREHEGQILHEDKQNELRQLIVQLCEAVGRAEPQKTRSDTHKYTALNNRLENLEVPFRISPSPDGNWIFRRFVDLIAKYENSVDDK